MWNLCCKFVELEEVSKADIIMNIDTANQKHPTDMLVRMLTEKLIKKLLHERGISQESYNKFFKVVFISVY